MVGCLYPKTALFYRQILWFDLQNNTQLKKGGSKDPQVLGVCFCV
jgi:hypothetical protein